MLGISRSWMKAGPPPNPWVYISDYFLNAVNIYSTSGSGQTPIGQISGLNEPQGMWVDVNQNLWVTNTGSQQIVGFHRGQGTSFKSFNDPTGYPASDCGNNNKNIIYSLDINGNDGPGNTINVFNKSGGSSPIASFTDPNASALLFCAVDKHGNLWVTLSQATYPYAGEVDEFPKNSETPIVIANNLVYPLGITVDKYNAVSVNDTFANCVYPYTYCYGTVYVYDPPYTGPAYWFNVPDGIAETALNKQQTSLWGAYAYGPAGIEFSYPAGTFQNETSNQNLEGPNGIALTPPASGK